MKSQKFLQFNGKNIFFQTYDGQFWIAIKPICDALNVNYNRAFQNLKYDPDLSRVFANQQMHDSINRMQKMTCLPEKYIYGWIFSLQSKSEELREYKMECYEVLYNYFHGTITGRKEILKKKIEIDVQMLQLENALLESPEYLKIQELKKQQNAVGKELKMNDKIAIDEITLFNYEDQN